ncbi:hypothetical protein ACQ4PT_009199 [Festuca glaucescens]
MVVKSKCCKPRSIYTLQPSLIQRGACPDLTIYTAMSSRHETREEGRAVPVADAAPGDTVPMVITASGNHGIPVLITPTVTGATASFQGFLVLQQEAAKKEEEEAEDPLAERKKWFREMRGWLMVLATVAASVAYQAGLNPPGGFWQDNNGGHRAGNPVLRDQHWVRYILFYYFQRDGVRDVAGDHGAAHERAVLPRGGQGDGAHVHHLHRPRQPRRRLHRRHHPLRLLLRLHRRHHLRLLRLRHLHRRGNGRNMRLRAAADKVHA